MKLSQEEQAHVKRIVRRDATFLIIGAVIAGASFWMELNAGNIEYRGISEIIHHNTNNIIDAGFIATTPLHNFLKANRGWNDFFAFINTLVGVFGPVLYMLYQTIWIGDYEPAFRYLTISGLRSVCGWCTFLPPDPDYLMSFQDFPDIIQCMMKDCGDVESAQVNPFLSFFSGHVATLVMCANHLYLRGNKRWSYFFHAFNVFQIIRLLATRGHYSIDIVIGWFMATQITNPSGRLGRYYSKGEGAFRNTLPSSPSDIFEKLTGVDVVKDQAKMSVLMKMSEVQTLLTELQEDDYQVFAGDEPTARLAARQWKQRRKQTVTQLDELLGIISESTKKLK